METVETLLFGSREKQASPLAFTFTFYYTSIESIEFIGFSITSSSPPLDQY